MLTQLLPFLLVQVAMVSSPWNALLDESRTLMGENTYTLLQRQHHEFIGGNSPTIADTRIKRIPIVEAGEPLIDLWATNHARISALSDQELPAAHYAPEDIDPRAPSYSMVRKSVFEALMRMVQELDTLAPHFGYEAGDLEIKLFEGLRDIATQKELFDTKFAAIRAHNPHLSLEQAYIETSKWVSPYIDNVPTHSTGAAIDIVLWSKKKNRFCDMGRFNVGGVNALTFSEDATLTTEQRNNRLLFLIAATRAGLTNYLYEFWHFSYGDRYARYWRESDPKKRIARYGSL